MKIAWTALLLAALAAGPLLGAADMVILHAKVFVPGSPVQFAQAVAIERGRISAVGTDNQIARLAGGGTIRVDAQHHLVIPGFNDAHVHFDGFPPGFAIACDENSSLAQIGAAITQSIDETPPDLWLYGAIGPQVLADPQATSRWLDQAAPGRKIMLKEFTGHGLILSSAALTALGATVPVDPIGGSFGRNNGTLNGKVFEYAEYNLLHKLAELSTDDDNVADIEHLCDTAAQFGITTLQIMPWPPAAHFAALVGRAHPAARIRLMRIPGTDKTVIHFDDNRDPRIGAVKWLLDGTPLERGAAIRQPYGPNLGNGQINFTDGQIDEMLKDAAAHNEQPLFHAAGDRTVAALLKALEATKSLDWPTKHVRIEHGDGVQSDLISLVAKYGIVVVQNPTHFPARRFYPPGEYMLLATLLRNGVHLAFGSDGVLDPFVNLQLAVTHPLVPTEAISLADAITAYTAGSAYAEKAENKGKIAIGQIADLAILSNDLFTISPNAYPGTQSLMTIIAGKIVYDSGVLPH